MTDKLIKVTQQNKILSKTPKKHIRQRVGRGGMTFNYVEVGYVVKQLNDAFNFMWDFEVIDHQVGKKQVWVKGKLTVHLSPEFRIIKTAYGGSDIKRIKGTVNVVDIADDLKAAQSDALKKSASLIGIASDVYYPNVYGEDQSEADEQDWLKDES